jgi:prefoldin alpha subunit
MKKENHKEENKADMQNKFVEISMLEGKLKQLEQSLNFLDQQIMEQQLLQLNLDEIKKMKKGQEMLFLLGKSVFIKGKIDEPELLVNVGSNALVKKNAEKAKEIVERQKLQIASIRGEIAREMEKILGQISIIEHSMHQHEHQH